MNFVKFEQLAKIEVNKRVSKGTEKLLIGILLIGFILITALWGPSLFVKEAPPKNILATRSTERESLSNSFNAEELSNTDNVAKVESKPSFNIREDIT